MTRVLLQQLSFGWVFGSLVLFCATQPHNKKFSGTTTTKDWLFTFLVLTPILAGTKVAPPNRLKFYLPPPSKLGDYTNVVSFEGADLTASGFCYLFHYAFLRIVTSPTLPGELRNDTCRSGGYVATSTTFTSSDLESKSIGTIQRSRSHWQRGPGLYIQGPRMS